VTDLKHQLTRLGRGSAGGAGRMNGTHANARRRFLRRTLALAAAGTVGAAGATAAVIVPMTTLGGGDRASITVGAQPSASTSAAPGKCYVLLAAPQRVAKQAVERLVRSGEVGADPTITRHKSAPNGKTLLEVCARGTTPMNPLPEADEQSQPPVGPAYEYDEKPAAIAARLGAHLHDRVSRFGLSISYTRPFSQESSKLDDGRPAYYGGNVDVREKNGYGDIGVQVTHEVTELVPFTGECRAADDCVETTLADGSVLRTGRVDTGGGDAVLTAEVHRPDGIVVQAQQSNYPFGPEAGSQRHGDQPLTLDQLVSLATDDAFTF